MQLMLSAPNPSDAAKFIGQILSIINSMILDNVPPPLTSPLSGDLPPFFVGLFMGEVDLREIPVLAEAAVVDLCLLGDTPFRFCSYTKSTAC